MREFLDKPKPLLFLKRESSFEVRALFLLILSDKLIDELFFRRRFPLFQSG